MRPILFAKYSVNHRLPSGPDVMDKGSLLGAGIGNPVIVPDGVMRPIRGAILGPRSVHHRLPSGPEVISPGVLPGRSRYSVISPEGVIRPTLSPKTSVNHRLPSGPAVMPNGPLAGVGTVYS